MAARSFHRTFRSRRALQDELKRIESDYEAKILAIKKEREILQPITAKKSVRRQIAAIQAEIANIERHEYGSYTPGVGEWRRKWDETPNRRVLMFARKDFSGSLYRWAHAVNDFTPWAARLAVLERHPYGYSNDLVFPLPEFAESDLSSLLSEASVIHIKDENGYFDGSLRLPADFFSRHGCPLVFTHYGGFARSLEQHKEYRSFVMGFDGRIAMTPDLLFPWFDGFYIPHAIDTRDVDNEWEPGWRLAHSPSNPERKGTDALEQAVDSLRADIDVDFDLIHGVPFAESVARKRKATLFFDQAGRESKASLGVSTIIGWYGNSALESAVYGIPTMAHMSESALSAAHRSRGSIMEDLAILNVGTTPAEMHERLRWFFMLGEPEQRLLSHVTREWIEKFHSYEATGRELGRYYDQLVGSGEGRNLGRISEGGAG